MSSNNPVTSLCGNNPNDLLDAALWMLKAGGVPNESRNGKVVQAPGPTAITYLKPDQRVLFSHLRDANPFFHLYESLWMLAGRRDAESVSYYAKQMASFAEDGVLWGAYGYRWRQFFGFDQLEALIELLKRDPKTRRAVLTMWAPVGDLCEAFDKETEDWVQGVYQSKDVPCNTHVYFDTTQGPLNMTVCNRSNDVIWGTFGANSVHMSMLQEFMAHAVGAPLGTYTQFTNNLHLYAERDDVVRLADFRADHSSQWRISYAPYDRYASHTLRTMPLMDASCDPTKWLEDCEQVVAMPTSEHAGRSAWFRLVASPMFQAHAAYKGGDWAEAFARIDAVEAQDWKLAGQEWLARRKMAQERSAA